MIQANYPDLVRKIAESSGLPLSEIEKRVDEKKAKLSDLISREGAAQIVAAELGVTFDKQKTKINGLLVGMKKASITAKVLRIFPIRPFKTKTGADSKVANLSLADDTGLVKAVLWDLNQIKLLEEGQVKEGDFVDLKDGSVRQGMNGKEIHIGSFSGFSLSKEVIENVMSYEDIKNKLSAEALVVKKISELYDGDRASMRAVVLQVFEPKFFNVCPECGKKPVMEAERYNCATHGSIIPKERSLMTLVVDDGTGNIRAVCFSDVITKLFGISEEEVRGLSMRKDDILGKEFVFNGRARKNPVFDSLEFTISGATEVDPQKLVQELQGKA